MRKSNQYTIIIPTMYFHNTTLETMLLKYEQCPYVKEVLIVNNNASGKVDFNFSKVRVIGIGLNLYVNPSWKFGIKMAATENIVLANDDILIEGNLKELFVEVSKINLNNAVVGSSLHCYKEKGLSIGKIRVSPYNALKMSHGFGTFMILTKKSFRKVYIPKEIKVWYGDMIMFDQLTTYVFEGLEIITKFAGTSSKVNLKGFARKEKLIYEQLQ